MQPSIIRIQSIARMFVSDEESAMKIVQDLKADYLLVYVVGQVNSMAKPILTEQKR